jgi:DNA-binding transcriptional LysR family regulator
MALRLEQLRYFATVAEEGQITRAARKLHIAQPALSQAIAQLEADLGIELLQRHPRGVALTPAGERFLEKARIALAASNDAALTAEALARAASRVLQVGFIGPPPAVNAPELFDAFALANPDARLSFRELPFPTGPTGSWLGEVDVAFCHTPAEDAGVLVQALRPEARAVIAPSEHWIAGQGEVHAEDMLGERFISYHPAVQSSWAGFHSLDDLRGGPPEHLTDDRVSTPAEMLKGIAGRRAITCVPASDAEVIEGALRGVVAIRVRDADPFALSLLWRADQASPLLDALIAFARVLADGPSAEQA